MGGNGTIVRSVRVIGSGRGGWIGFVAGGAKAPRLALALMYIGEGRDIRNAPGFRRTRGFGHPLLMLIGSLVCENDKPRLGMWCDGVFLCRQGVREVGFSYCAVREWKNLSERHGAYVVCLG